MHFVTGKFSVCPERNVKIYILIWIGANLRLLLSLKGWLAKRWEAIEILSCRDHKKTSMSNHSAISGFVIRFT